MTRGAPFFLRGGVISNEIHYKPPRRARREGLLSAIGALPNLPPSPCQGTVTTENQPRRQRPHSMSQTD